MNKKIAKSERMRKLFEKASEKYKDCDSDMGIFLSYSWGVLAQDASPASIKLIEEFLERR